MGVGDHVAFSHNGLAAHNHNRRYLVGSLLLGVFCGLLIINKVGLHQRPHHFNSNALGILNQAPFFASQGAPNKDKLFVKLILLDAVFQRGIDLLKRHLAHGVKILLPHIQQGGQRLVGKGDALDGFVASGEKFSGIFHAGGSAAGK